MKTTLPGEAAAAGCYALQAQEKTRGGLDGGDAPTLGFPPAYCMPLVKMSASRRVTFPLWTRPHEVVIVSTSAADVFATTFS